MCSSEILIYNKDEGFYRINEGTGDNIHDEDIEYGYIDYIMIDKLEYNGNNFEEVDGAQVMLAIPYQDMFDSTEDVIKHLIQCCWISDIKWIVLYEN